mgnify:CR=1 FL=1
MNLVNSLAFVGAIAMIAWVVRIVTHNDFGRSTIVQRSENDQQVITDVLVEDDAASRLADFGNARRDE